MGLLCNLHAILLRPRYPSPLDAMKGPRETLMYVVCIQPDRDSGKSDLLATVDIDPASPTYCQVK